MVSDGSKPLQLPNKARVDGNAWPTLTNECDGCVGSQAQLANQVCWKPTIVRRPVQGKQRWLAVWAVPATMDALRDWPYMQCTSTQLLPLDDEVAEARAAKRFRGSL